MAAETTESHLQKLGRFNLRLSLHSLGEAFFAQVMPANIVGFESRH